MKESEYFNQIELPPGEEESWEKRFDLTMDPREWVARNGHLHISGDYRRFKISNPELKAWLHKAAEALLYEELEDLWNEFLTKDEAIQNRIVRDDIVENGP